jgi:hypothetical protein
LSYLQQDLIFLSAETDSLNRIFWDQGPKAIERFMSHHAKICKFNKFCNDLKLRELDVLSDDENGSKGGQDIESESDEITVMTPRCHCRNPHNKGFPTP